MTLPTGTPGGPRRAGLVRALDAVRHQARDQAAELLATVPDTGDVETGRAVDEFVEQAADALRALEETVSRTRRAVDAGMPAAESGESVEPLKAPSAGTQPGAYRGRPEAWR